MHGGINIPLDKVFCKQQPHFLGLDTTHTCMNSCAGLSVTLPGYCMSPLSLQSRMKHLQRVSAKKHVRKSYHSIFAGMVSWATYQLGQLFELQIIHFASSFAL